MLKGKSDGEDECEMIYNSVDINTLLEHLILSDLLGVVFQT